MSLVIGKVKNAGKEGVRASFTNPTKKLHWKMSKAEMQQWTRDSMPNTIRGFMAHLSKLNQEVGRARELVLHGDRLLKHVETVLGKKLDKRHLEKWNNLMAEVAYFTHSFFSRLLGFLDHGRRKVFEIGVRGEMTVHRV